MCRKLGLKQGMELRNAGDLTKKNMVQNLAYGSHKLKSYKLINGQKKRIQTFRNVVMFCFAVPRFWQVDVRQQPSSSIFRTARNVGRKNNIKTGLVEIRCQDLNWNTVPGSRCKVGLL